jgi:hypothetical protein
MANSMVVTINIGIGTITANIEGAENEDVLYSIKKEIVNALESTNLDIQSVETTITEQN